MTMKMDNEEMGVVNRTEFWEEEGSVADAMALLSEIDAG